MAVFYILAVIGLLSFNSLVTEADMVPQPSNQSAPPYVVISGCNNNCEVACCYCNILRSPPFCEKCCHPS
ncbi:hypothetical protein LUZ61_012452 [Rhynchospora tenuis]|uniref:Uncharacterized protein n=1 Tax=Rhynchospora tenuis TaxID=198213 RepID=A0AAD6F162_9POAL|nr:hypothetical protein LUZ61_012452 [Rhynchospora tenuis]